MWSRHFTTMIAALALVACSDTAPIDQLSYTDQVKLAQTLVERCESQGISQDSPQMEACFRAEADAEISRRAEARERREDFGQALSLGLQAYGQGLQSASRSSYPRSSTSMHCTSNRMGTYTYTNCY